MKDTLTIVDGNYLMIRCCAANPDLRSPTGDPTGGIYIFLKSLYSLMKDSQKILVCFDGGHNQKRKEVYPEYKANRHKDPNDPLKVSLEFSFKHITPILQSLGIPSVRITGEEADDLIYAYSRYFSDRYSVVVASDDSDYLQMVSSNVKVLRPMKGEYVTLDNFEEIIGYQPRYHILYKSLLGDKSDNISSPCKGFGEKTVSSVIQYLQENDLEPTLENVKNFVDLNSKRKVFQRFSEENGLRILKRNMYLIDISRIASGESYNEYIRQLIIAEELVNPDPVYIRDIFNKFGFRSLTPWIVYVDKKYKETQNA